MQIGTKKHHVDIRFEKIQWDGMRFPQKRNKSEKVHPVDSLQLTEAMPMKHVNIRIEGKVQGVFFRWSAKNKADELGIRGFVRNEPDGCVSIEAESDNDIQLSQFIEWCHEGPQYAHVADVETSEGAVQDFSSFRISH